MHITFRVCTCILLYKSVFISGGHILRGDSVSVRGWYVSMGSGVWGYICQYGVCDVYSMSDDVYSVSV